MRARSRVSNWRRGGRARKSRKRRRRIILPDVAANPGSTWLIIGGWLSVAAALLHIACIFGGPDWYRFFGAGEGMARAAARGDLRPKLITLRSEEHTSAPQSITANWDDGFCVEKNTKHRHRDRTRQHGK